MIPSIARLGMMGGKSLSTHIRGSPRHASRSKASITANRFARLVKVARDGVVVAADEVELEHVIHGSGNRVGCEGQSALADIDLDGGCASRSREGDKKAREHV